MCGVATQKLLLLDTASLYFRAFYALPSSLRGADGTPVNAVRGLLEFLAKFVSQASPTHIACCWDDDWRPAWRVELVPTYKTHRLAVPAEPAEATPNELEPQVPLIRDCLAALGVPVVGAAAAEADDVIGTLAAHSPIPAEVVTGDRDLFQVVDDARGITVRYVGAGMNRSELVTDEWLLAKYGFSGSGYADFSLMRGDASDGLPGVAGIGEKTAAALIAKHGDLEGVLTAAQEGSLAPAITRNLTAAIDYLGAARQVVHVNTDLPGMPPYESLLRPAIPADRDRFDALSTALNLGGAADRIVAALWG